jgi:hypothetical protein
MKGGDDSKLGMAIDAMNRVNIVEGANIEGQKKYYETLKPMTIQGFKKYTEEYGVAKKNLETHVRKLETHVDYHKKKCKGDKGCEGLWDVYLSSVLTE